MAPEACSGAALAYLLLPFVRLDQVVDLGFDGFKVERGRCLHRRIFDRRLRQSPHALLYENEAPELSCVEIVHVTAAEAIERLASDRRRSLKRILTDVDDRRHVGCHLFSRPPLRLLVELEFRIVDPDSAKFRSAEVVKFMAFRRTVAQQQVHLIVAIQMVLVGSIPRRHAF